ncbi:hydantoinase B/oxoprolinase family protein [Candidatus Protofrankia californiensis]|uniref:hydantoinase B/oxoprolinase family protein n=1 Tax=Candidatus Protofrankia californiensis TaxID=1839754 RepID=UPI001041111E|nr:hydantoinase B/oxoprolinase family protein [Candidatus Protofrankia californiensis]
MSDPVLSSEEKALQDEFLADNVLFLAPDPDIFTNHKIVPRTPEEDTILSQGKVSPHLANEIRGRLMAALDESNTMMEQMGTAPGAKWGDLVAAIFTASGDLTMIAPHGVVAFAGACHYPIKFIIRHWKDDPTVGYKDGDAFIHNDARYGGLHNTDQSTMMPLFWKGRVVAWLAATIHEGENGSTEPGGMPAAAESKFDEGLKMPPFKFVENFQIRRDLQTFLQNSVRDPKLQYEDMKVKLHAVLRLRERVLAVFEEFGEEAVIGTLRQHIEDVETEVRRRIRELPDGTTRVSAFVDSTLRENVVIKYPLAITVEGDQLTLDFRGSAPEFLNRSVNTNQGSMKCLLLSGYLQNIWPDLPHSQAVFSPLDFRWDEYSWLNGSFMSPQAMSLIPLFKAMTLPCVPMAKLSYMLPRQYTSIVAPQYDQPATVIYGGHTQNGEDVGNFCADINGAPQGGRYNRDGEHSISPPFAAYCDIGEIEVMEEEVPMIRLGAFTLAKDRIGFGKYRGGLGYEQIVTTRKTALWGFMSGCTGSLITPTQALFGGYAPPTYPLCKVSGVNVFEELEKNSENIKFDILDIMNRQPFEGATYSTHDMGMTFELVRPGELHMVCQGTGAGYGDVLQRDPTLVMKDIEEDLMSRELASEIYKVAFDPETSIVDDEATEALRNEERQARIARGKPFDEFVAEWVRPEPPEDMEYYGAWGRDTDVVYGTSAGQRITMEGRVLQSMFMPNPKDVKIAQLQAEITGLKAQLSS